VLRAAVAILARVMCLGAIISFVVAMGFTARVGPNASAIHVARVLSPANGRDLLVRLVGESALLLVAVMLSSSMGWRRVLATGLPSGLSRLLNAARRIRLDAAVDTRPISSLSGIDIRRRDRDASVGAVVEQLRCALVSSPSAPPLRPNSALERLLQRVESIHVAEVAVAH
jgi:hypothetical protein